MLLPFNIMGNISRAVARFQQFRIVVSLLNVLLCLAYLLGGNIVGFVVLMVGCFRVEFCLLLWTSVLACVVKNIPQVHISQTHLVLYTLEFERCSGLFLSARLGVNICNKIYFSTLFE